MSVHGIRALAKDKTGPLSTVTKEMRHFLVCYSKIYRSACLQSNDKRIIPGVMCQVVWLSSHTRLTRGILFRSSTGRCTMSIRCLVNHVASLKSIAMFLSALSFMKYYAVRMLTFPCYRRSIQTSWSQWLRSLIGNIFTYAKYFRPGNFAYSGFHR